MNIAVLIATQLVFLLCYIELQESYGNGIMNCLKKDDNDKCMCCKSGYRGSTCDINCNECSSRLIKETNCSYSCRNGYYGDTCNKTCPKTCAVGVNGVHFCTETNGTIDCNYGCTKGYTGKQCSICIDNHYHGDHCNITCSKGCLSETCNRTGHCAFGCKDGFYGGGCTSHCGINCMEGKCTQDIISSYICTEGCVDGYMGSNCAKKCPVQCATCEQWSGSCMSCVGNYVHMPETGECKNQLAKALWITMGLAISLGILAIPVIAIVRLKKKWSGYDVVSTNGQERCMEPVWNVNVKYKWDEEEVDELRTSILQLGKQHKLKLLVFGLTGHGKSSLCNGFRSALLGQRHVSQYHQTRTSGAHVGSKSFTKGFCASDYGEDFWIIDMGGIYESKRFTNKAITKILSGEVPIHAKLTEHLEAEEKVISQTGASQKQELSCIIIVLMPNTDFGKEVKRQLEIVDDLAGKGVISRHLVLTHLDKIDPIFTDPTNLPHLFDSQHVQRAVRDTSRKTGIGLNTTNVVRNYVNETETNVYSNTLLLKTLENIVNNAVENIERRNTHANIMEILIKDPIPETSN